MKFMLKNKIVKIATSALRKIDKKMLTLGNKNKIRAVS